MLFSGSRKVGKHLGEKYKYTDNINIDEIDYVKRFSDLKTDEFLSGSYIKDLIKNSKTQDELAKVQEYLMTKDKVTNIPKDELRELKGMLQQRHDGVVARFFKEKDISLEDIAEFMRDLQ